MTEIERRRRRPTVSCSVCRRRKIRCNRESPCSNCVRSRHDVCVYEVHPPPSPRRHPTRGQTASSRHELGELWPIPVDRASSTSKGSTVPGHLSNSAATSSTSPSTPASQPSALEFESMKSRIRHLEEQLSQATLKSIQPAGSNSNTEIVTSGICGTAAVYRESRGSSQPIPRSVTHKKRMFGQSHWINGAVLLFEPPLRDERLKVFSGAQRCKSLAKIIKSHRAPLWPSPQTTDLPPKIVADELVDCYLRTTESIYRVLHVPTFKRDYAALWLSDTAPDAGFLIQLKLVLAIGAATHDEKFSLRVSAVRWVYEAQTWLLAPKYKARLTIQSLQTTLLLLLARETTGIGEELIWISAGALFRKAMYIGLHRDPKHLQKTTTFVVEMRRRLWNTVLEVALQSSLTSGGPPLISIDDFDTEPPANFDDDQLMTEDPVPKAENSFTQVSIAIALRRMFPVRLAVAKFLNDLRSSGTYEETLQIDSELRASYKVICQTLQAWKLSTGPSPSKFEIGIVDFIVHRFRLALHVPFFGLALQETAYAFSRKVVVESSLKIWYAAYPPSSPMATQPQGDIASSDHDDLARLTVCGSGFYRTVSLQASILISVEARTQLQEESLGPVSVRPDLLPVVEDVKTWSFRCIEAGETNIKGYLLTHAIKAQIEGLMRGQGKDEVVRSLAKAVDDAEELCFPVLQEMAAQAQVEGTVVDHAYQSPSDTPHGVSEGWDFLMSDVLFNPDSVEPMGWGFNTETLPTQALW